MDKYKHICFDKLHDCILDLFDVNATNDQLYNLCEFVLNQKQVSYSIDELIDLICLEFVGFSVPTYGSTEEYKTLFWETVKIKRSDLIKKII